MTLKEIKQRFESGEKLKTTFGIKKMTYEIGDNSITKLQHENLLKSYDEKNIEFEADFSGFTTHYRTFKP